MRTLKFKIQTALIIVLTIIIVNSLQAQMLIKPDGNGTDINGYAMLQLVANGNHFGFMIPSVNYSSLPAATTDGIKGLLVFVTSGGPSGNDAFYFSDGSAWRKLDVGTTSTQWTTSGNNIYYNTGNIGIGTTTPATKLHVDNGALYVQGIDNTADNYTLLLRNQNTDNMMIVYNNGKTYMKGNVGIGTTSPSRLLSLSGSQSVISLYNSGTNTWTGLEMLANNGTLLANIGLDDASGRIGINMKSDGTEDFTITQNGNVGIGTTSPAYKLDINGATTRLISNSEVYTANIISNTGTGNALTYYDASDGDLGGGDYAHIGQYNDLTLRLVTESNAGNIIIMPKNGSGNVGIGTTDPDVKLKVVTNVADYTAALSNTLNSKSSMGLFISNGSNSEGGAAMVGFYRPDGTPIGSITQNTATTVAYNTTSDRRLKDNIVNTHFGINDLMKIQVRDYFYKADPNKTPTTGFIAQELYDIFPNAVTKPANEEEMWSIDYGKVTPLLTKAIQEQQTEIEDLKSKNKEYEERLSKLERNNQNSVTAGIGGNNLMVFSVIGFGIAGLVMYGFKKRTK